MHLVVSQATPVLPADFPVLQADFLVLQVATLVLPAGFLEVHPVLLEGASQGILVLLLVIQALQVLQVGFQADFQVPQRAGFRALAPRLVAYLDTPVLL